VQRLVRFSGGHVDCASNRVPPEQSALGSTQHLDAFNVHQVQHAADGLGHIDAVEVDTHAGLGSEREVNLADAADED
jgi:hypothetical protein